MVFVDTNIWLYAIGAEHPLREPCRGVLRRIREGSLSANTNTEVVQELLYVLTRRGEREEALRLSRNVLALFPSMLSVTHGDMRLACDLLEQNPGVSSRDAVHAATMRNNDLDVLVSTDTHFDALDAIERIDPATSES